MALTTYAEAERFWKFVDVRGPDECWPWIGKSRSAGYGSFRVGSLTDGTRRQIGAHRWVCARVHGMRPEQHALHHCDNRICVNPGHLYPGSPADNSRDAVERGRIGYTGNPGGRNPNAKLTEDDAREILRSTTKNVELARRYGVSKTQIGHIKSGKSWGHLHGA